MQHRKFRLGIWLLVLNFLINSFLPGQTFTRIYHSDCTRNPVSSYPALFSDITRDSFPELFVGKIKSNDNMLYVNDNGKLLSDPVINFYSDKTFIAGSTVADADNDGFRDIFLCLKEDTSIWLKGAAAGFSVLQFSPFVEAMTAAESASWVDYDNDGWVDLFLTTGKGKRNQLFKNSGFGNFFPIDTTLLTADSTGFYTYASWSDVNDDGWQDVFISNQFGNGCFFLNQQNGNFTKVESPPFDEGLLSHSSSWADFDNDGDMDLFLLGGTIFAPQRIYVFENTGNGSFVKNATTGLSDYEAIATGSSWGDFDKDGFIDLIVVQHLRAPNDKNILFFKNNGNKTFVLTRVLTESLAQARALINADIDNDGDLDIFIATENREPDVLFLNTTAQNNWIKFSLSGITSNKSAIGAKVHAFCTINGKSQILTREISGQTGWHSQNDLTVHFGLGDVTCVDSVVIHWPSGKRCVYIRVPANRFYWIDENCESIAPTLGYLELGNDTAVCEGKPMFLRTAEPLTLWSNGERGSAIPVSESGIYWAMVEGGCVPLLSDTIQVSFVQCGCLLDVPTAFSPNGDQTNDFFGPVYECPIAEFNMTIFNRWGDRVFESNNIEQMWDGTFMGRDMPIGIYTYRISYTDPYKKTEKFLSGKVTLVR
jgi:gliding motility-associated-like protein